MNEQGHEVESKWDVEELARRQALAGEPIEGLDAVAGEAPVGPVAFSQWLREQMITQSAALIGAGGSGLADVLEGLTALPRQLGKLSHMAAILADNILHVRMDLELTKVHLKAMEREATIAAWREHGDTKPAPYRDAVIEKAIAEWDTVVSARNTIATYEQNLANLEDTAAHNAAERVQVRATMGAHNRFLDLLVDLIGPVPSVGVTECFDAVEDTDE